ncbi:aminodeoxychorismate/anthranilate synthase component II [Mobilicoccus pelagius]|uniref:Anthranilate synthase component II n=1 Tax=Mobilicoccus pelagius NBRC 104925 TaxID=1089455 RepID=H5USU5_9MICO|nr:aminodeoxychorismate/anthranilate synthase component II [Mobilicoccus pelagius]GAB48803.1 anthranilate synthase component II [Mobilicoccus pelagius NBRC 104925]
MSRILVVDNYDSFVFTIVGYLRSLGAECDVHRNDAVDVSVVAEYDGVLVSPGPGAPEEAGASMDVVRACGEQEVPMLGVCLGHQALAAVYGAVVGRAPELLHGKTSPISHDGTGILAGLPDPFVATRYHSLAIEDGTLPPELVANAWVESPSGRIVQGIRHRDLPLHGVQFHPESVLTEGGHRMLATWLEMCGDEDAVPASVGLGPLLTHRE